MSDVQLVKIFNSVWLPIGMKILVKVGNNVAPRGIVDTLKSGIIMHILYTQKYIHSQTMTVYFRYCTFSSTVCGAIML